MEQKEPKIDPTKPICMCCRSVVEVIPMPRSYQFMCGKCSEKYLKKPIKNKQLDSGE